MPRRRSSEGWTRQLTQLECNRRGWEFRDTTWAGYKRKSQPFPRTYDLFGCIDGLASGSLWPEGFAIQFTSWTNVAARIKKCREEHPDALEFLQAMGLQVLVWGWRQDGKLREHRFDGLECERVL